MKCKAGYPQINADLRRFFPIGENLRNLRLKTDGADEARKNNVINNVVRISGFI